MNKVSRREELLNQIEENHDWLEGRVWGHGGTAYSQNDICQLCGLNRRWAKDSQNGVPSHYTFSTRDGEVLTIGEASVKECF